MNLIDHETNQAVVLGYEPGDVVFREAECQLMVYHSEESREFSSFFGKIMFVACIGTDKTFMVYMGRPGSTVDEVLAHASQPIGTGRHGLVRAIFPKLIKAGLTLVSYPESQDGSEHE